MVRNHYLSGEILDHLHFMGFAARPNMAILEVREGFQGAFDHVGSGLESVCKEGLSSLATLSPP